MVLYTCSSACKNRGGVEAEQGQIAGLSWIRLTASKDCGSVWIDGGRGTGRPRKGTIKSQRGAGGGETARGLGRSGGELRGGGVGGRAEGWGGGQKKAESGARPSAGRSHAGSRRGGHSSLPEEREDREAKEEREDWEPGEGAEGDWEPGESDKALGDGGGWD